MSQLEKITDVQHSVGAVTQFSDTMAQLELNAVNNLVMKFDNDDLDHDSLIKEVAKISAYRATVRKLDVNMKQNIANIEKELGDPHAA